MIFYAFYVYVYIILSLGTAESSMATFVHFGRNLQVQIRE